jgi:hypothetical protein
MIAILAWRPFLDPLNIPQWWWAFVLPLTFLIAVAYKAIRSPDLEEPGGVKPYLRSVVVMTVQTIAALIILWIGFFLFTVYLLPIIAPMPG